MLQKNEERMKVLQQQKQQLEANLFKVMGAIELLEALDKEEVEGNPDKKETKSATKTKKVKH